jgi:purine nucleosidase/pyrimidine-specific ribonucleoside hydrolase
MLVRLDLQDIPIGAGRDIPLEGENAFPDPWRSATDEFWGINLPGVDDYIYTSSAVEIIIGVLEESPWPVTVFVSGTHTNLAAALRLKPDIGKKIAAVQVMGGAFYVPGNIESDWPEIHNKTAEWNIWVDPVAASEVFNSNLSIHVTPLDATNQVIWTSHDADVWEASGTPEGVLAAEILRWMLDSWYPEGVYAWDLVAAVNVTHPDFCEQEQIHVDIITAPGDEEGRTIVVNDKPSNATVCLTPQVDEIKNLVAHVLSLP